VQGDDFALTDNRFRRPLCALEHKVGQATALRISRTLQEDLLLLGDARRKPSTLDTTTLQLSGAP
jgi:hypothetical protein